MSEEQENIAAPESSMTVDKIVDERGVPLGNTLKEMTRKFGNISKKLDMILQNNVPPSYSTADNASDNSPVTDEDVKTFIRTQRAEKAQAVNDAQLAVLDVVFKTFPELDQQSDDFDKAFFDLAVKHEKSINQADPDRSIKAAKLAALDLGKMEKLTKSKVLQDDARRSRILSEGGTSTKESSAKSAPKSEINKSFLNQYFKLDAAKVAKYAKEES